MKITSLIQTCDMCPSQWEFKTENGSYGYIRYRFGKLTIYLSDNEEDLFNDDNLILWALFGHNMDGVLSNENMIKILEGMNFKLEKFRIERND